MAFTFNQRDPMRNHIELMVDLETLGTKESSPIVAIGACLFNPYVQNTFEALMEATKVCSLGQITQAMYEVGGQYRRNM